MQRFQVLALGLDTLHTRKIWIPSSLVRVCRRDPGLGCSTRRGTRAVGPAGLRRCRFTAFIVSRKERLGGRQRGRAGDLVSQLDLRAFSLSGLHDTPDTSLMYLGQVGSLVLLQLLEGIRKTS